MIRSRRVFAVVAALAIVSASPIATLASCVPGRAADAQHYHGYALRFAGSSSSTYVRAVESRVDDYEPYASTTGFSAAYVMLRVTVTGGTYYAQTGWFQLAGGFHRTFYEHGYTGTGGFFRDYYPSGPTGPAHFARVVWNNAPGNGEHAFYFYRDETIVFVKILNWSPKDGEISGEVFSKSNQFPGETGDKVEMVDSQAHVGGAWVDYGTAPLEVGQSATWSNMAQVSQTWFRTWDSAC